MSRARKGTGILLLRSDLPVDVGNATGYLVNGALLAGATTATVDGGTGRFVLGEKAVFAGHATRYTVTSQSPASGNLTQIGFEPALTSNVPDNAAITLATPVWTPVAEIVTLTPPGYTRNEIESSNHNEGVESKILGMLRQGSVAGTCNWIPDDPSQSDEAGGLLHDIVNDVHAMWQIRIPPQNPGYPRITFPARVNAFAPEEVGMDAIMRMRFGLSVSGPLVVDLAAAA